jgi:glycosyltransferase involved in cell wall biosynthesis
MTTGGWDLQELNETYGTRIRQSEVSVRIAPVPFYMRSLSATAIRCACYQRFARQIAGEYDVRVSAYNLTDWGLPAIHFIADFSWHRNLREYLDPLSPGIIYLNTIVRKTYLKLADTYRSPSGRDSLRYDSLIANSRWSANLVRQYCGVNCTAVIYPPVATGVLDIPWGEREHAFVMISRIAPEKRVERAITILESVRKRGFCIKFHLCGKLEKNSYGRRIFQLCSERADWIVLEGHVSGTKKAEILTHCRFGIQARSAEPFGISVAEMMGTGEIVFAPNEGGQTEVLNHPDLLFNDIDDATDKICAVLSNTCVQKTLRAHLAKRRRMFGEEVFLKKCRAIFSS